MCDFRIREFGHPNYSHRYSIQCVLPINLYNQQIFTFLWFWFVILIISNIYALISWIYQFIPSQRKLYVKRHLKLLNKYQKLLYNKDDPSLRQAIKDTIDDFNKIYLKYDGIFIIKMVSILASDVVGTQIIHELWKRRKVNKKTELLCETDYENGNFDTSLKYNLNDNNDHFILDNKDYVEKARDNEPVVIIPDTASVILPSLLPKKARKVIQNVSDICG